MGDDVGLGLPAYGGVGPADQGEVVGQLEVLQHLDGGDLGLGSGHIQGETLCLQPGQQVRDAGVGGVFKLADGDVPGPEDPDGLLDPRLRHPEPGEGLPQGRAHKDPQLVPVCHRNAEVFQGGEGGVHDPRAGVGEGAV